MRRLKTVGEWILIAAGSLIVATLLFVNVGPRFLPYQALIVRSGSMSPAIPTGSVVVYSKAQASQLHVGQIIVFSDPTDPGKRITHRIFAIRTGPNGRYFLTKGDANSVADNWEVPAVGTGWVVAWHVPELGYAISSLQDTRVRIILIGVPLAAIAALGLLDRRKRDTPSESRPALETAPVEPATDDATV